GSVFPNGTLDGKLHECSPNHVHCVAEEERIVLASEKETVQCIERGRLWHEQNYCAFEHLNRSSYCDDARRCYGVRFHCDRRSILLTKISKISEFKRMLVGLVLLAVLLAVAYRALRRIQKSSTMDVKAMTKRHEEIRL
ncbi:hypothetical protein GCK32_019697, partial [Trichostrongylus colubriformis]